MAAAPRLVLEAKGKLSLDQTATWEIQKVRNILYGLFHVYKPIYIFYHIALLARAPNSAFTHVPICIHDSLGIQGRT